MVLMVGLLQLTCWISYNKRFGRLIFSTVRKNVGMKGLICRSQHYHRQ